MAFFLFGEHHAYSYKYRVIINFLRNTNMMPFKEFIFEANEKKVTVVTLKKFLTTAMSGKGLQFAFTETSGAHNDYPEDVDEKDYKFQDIVEIDTTEKIPGVKLKGNKSFYELNKFGKDYRNVTVNGKKGITQGHWLVLEK